jgi:hypothetical protein
MYSMMFASLPSDSAMWRVPVSAGQNFHLIQVDDTSDGGSQAAASSVVLMVLDFGRVINLNLT